MRTKTSVRIAVYLAAVLPAACGGPEPGSQEHLKAQIDAIDLPPALVELDQNYVESCPVNCPSLVVWYEVIGSPDAARAELLSAMTEAGWEINEGSAGYGVYSAKTEDHFLFVVVNQEMISGNAHAPPGTKVEIVVQRLYGAPEA